jgi:DNA ligase (NAD+)
MDQDPKYTLWRTLSLIISTADNAYYVRNDPIMDDAQYDKLRIRCAKLEKELGITEENSVLSSIPGSRGSGPTRVHPMLSLANIFTKEELEKYLQSLAKTGIDIDKIWFYLDQKLDGVSLELTYSRDALESEHVLTSATTRGDGHVGNEVHDNVAFTTQVPLNIPSTYRTVPILSNIVVRGEVVVDYVDFNRINVARERLGQKPFVSPRHAAGSLVVNSKQLSDYKDIRKSNPNWKPCKFYAYGVDDHSANNRYGIRNYVELVEFLKILGFCTIPGILVRRDAIWKTHENQMHQRHSQAYALDGTVVKVIDFGVYEQLGVTSHHPNYARAIKFLSEKATTKVQSVVFQIGRTGRITPVVEVSPITCGGVVISRTTLHNVEYLKKLDLHYGDIITLKRAGDVIPQIVSVDISLRKEDAKKIDIPTKCPVCGATLDNRGKQMLCPNKKCSGQHLALLTAATSRSGLHLEGFGEQLLSRLYDQGFLDHVLDLFSLTADQLQRVGVSAEYADTLISRIKTKLNKLQLFELLSILGISNLSRHTAQKLCQNFPTLTELYSATCDELMQINGIGKLTTKALYTYLRQIDLRNELSSRGIALYRSTPQDCDSQLSHWKVCITGTFKIPRRELEQRLISHGATIVNSVSSRTTHLLKGENYGETKVDLAIEKSIPILDQSDLDRILFDFSTSTSCEQTGDSLEHISLE